MADENNVEQSSEQEEIQRQAVDPIFEIDELVKDTYNNIAQWHNDDASSAGLKQLSLEIVENITKAALQHVGLTTTMNIDTTGTPKG